MTKSRVSDAALFFGDTCLATKRLPSQRMDLTSSPVRCHSGLRQSELTPGGESIEWVEGNAFPALEQYALCRCGNSNKKPFCDGTHAKIGFDGTETASRKPVMEQAQVLEGPSMQLADAEVLCAFARFCDPNGQVWNEV
jgi:CDGSH-type Zn-finger protein